MRRINALKDYLKTTTRRYNHGDTIEVEYGDQPHIKYENGVPTVVVSPNVKEWLGRDIDEVQEFRCILDDLNHEVEHNLRTPEDVKKEFMEQYSTTPKVAGRIWNLFEDVYIDKKRTDIRKGLRKARAFIVDRVMENHHRHGRIDNIDTKEAAALEGIFQVTHAGYAKGIQKSDDDLRRFLAWIRMKTLEVREIGGDDEEYNITEDSISGDGYYDEREELYHEVMKNYLAFIDHEDDAEDYAEDMHSVSGVIPNEDDLEFDEDSETPDSEESPDWDPESEEEQNEEGGDDQSGSSNQDRDAPDGEEPPQMGQAGVGEEEDSETGDEDSEATGEESADSDEAEDGDKSGDGEVGDGEAGEAEDGDSDSSGGPIDDDMEWDDNLSGEINGEGGPTEGEEKEEDIEGEVGDGQTPRNQATGTSENSEDAEVMDHVEAMDKLENDRESGEWFSVMGDSDYGDVDARFEERYADIQEQKELENTSTTKKQEKREEFIDDRSRPSDVYDLLEESGLADEIEEAFEELNTRDEWVPARRGSRVNVRAATRRQAGDFTENELYERKQRAEVGDRAVSVALDLSSSMPERDAKMALAALQKAVSIIGDQFTACGYSTFTPDGSSYTVVNTPLITAPDEDFEPHHLNAVWATGKTPTPSGIVEASRLLDECSKPEQLLIVITDGSPNVTSDGYGSNRKAMDESVQRVKELKRDGIKVIGMGVGNVNRRKMDQVFSDQYVVTDMDNFSEKLIEIYWDQMELSDVIR